MFIEGIVNRLCCQFFLKGRLIFYHWWYSIKSNPFAPVTSTATAENYPKEPFPLSHFYLTTSTFVTICWGTIIMDSNHRQDKTWLQTKSRLHVDLEDTEGKTAYGEYGMFA